MSDEKRIRDLFDRLVAMSPEPPPFPDETRLTRRAEPRMNPVLMFAGAAVAVLLLAAIPLYLLGGDGQVVATTTTSTVPGTETTDPSATTTSQPPSTTSTEPTTTQPAQVEVPVVVFLTQMPANAFVERPALVPFHTVVEAHPGDPAELVALAVLTHDALQPPQGFTSSIPAAVDVVAVTRSPEEHLITVDMNPAFLTGAGGLLADFTMLNQLIFTVTTEELTEVLFTVNGEPVDQFGADGLDLTEPVGRDAFVDQLNLINLDSAPIGSGEAPLVLSGIANVFEAMVSLEVLDGDGNVVHDQFTNASCGTGCWGSFSFSVDYPFAGGETIRVFQASAEDGSPTNVVTVPVLWDDPDGWELLP